MKHFVVGPCLQQPNQSKDPAP
jgi:hypothetical protein